MKTIAGVFMLLLVLLPVRAQDYNPAIEGIINQVQLDTLTSFVRILSGEDSVIIGDTRVLIDRRSDFTGKNLAANYIKDKFEGYGLDAYDQNFSGDGRNVFAVQTGSLYPDREYIICAHYDAVTTYCADDNASGVAAVLEAARILSSQSLNYTVIYAVWDKEEVGLLGSYYYAGQAEVFGEDIRGVLNLDMIGWDGNGDGLSEVHSRTVGSSMTLANLMVGIDSVYALPLNPVINTPGTTASDHASFWNKGFSAVLLIEAYSGGDFNPFYHSSADRLEKFDLGYFLNMTKLAVGSISTLATADPLVAVGENHLNLPPDYRIQNYPNPFNSSTVVRYELPEDGHTMITVYNSAGEKVGDLMNAFQKAGGYETGFTGGGLASGVYLIKIQSAAGVKISKMVLMK